MQQVKFVATMITLGFVALLTMSIFFGSWYTVSEGYRGVITRNGAVVGEATPGLHFKLPIVDSVTDMSVQTQRVDFEKVASYSKDIQLSESFVTINFRLTPEAVLRMYSEVGEGYAKKIMAGRIQKRFKEVFGKFSAAEIVSNRGIISDQIESALAEDMLEFGITIEDVQIVNVDFSDSYEAAVEAAARAEADVKKAKQELEKVRVDAERRVAEAEAQAKATRAAADAEAYATRARGEAEAAAIDARGKALKDNPGLVDLTAAEKWDGKLPQTMVPQGALPFVGVK